MLFLETSESSIAVFLGVLIALLICIGLIVLIISLKANDVFPFKRMRGKDDFDNCYDMSLRKFNTTHKKDEKGNKWKH